MTLTLLELRRVLR